MDRKNQASSFTVSSYTRKNLKAALFGLDPQLFTLYCPKHNLTRPSPKDPKWHYTYLLGYLGAKEIYAKTIIVEHDYRDHDFLSDYADYYVRCFASYERHCRRVHFFRNEISKDEFTAILQSGGKKAKAIEELQKGYLGFVTIRPLPVSPIGRTCLAVYGAEGQDGNRRYYPMLRKYAVSLFGINLEVKSLAFQEQDKVVSACATSALWVTLQTTEDFFPHAIPSPVEITKIAGEHWSGTRVLPNNTGLTANQMTYTLQKHGIQPQDLQPASKREFLAIAYSYLRSRLPILHNIRLLLYHPEQFEAELLGNHAIVLTGYGVNEQAINAQRISTRLEEIIEFRLYSDNITKLYVHDDNIGPFSRVHVMGMDNLSDEVMLESVRYAISKDIKDPQRPIPEYLLKYGAHDNVKNAPNQIIAAPMSTIIPLHPKMRFSFNDVYNICKEFHSYYCKYLSEDDKDGNPVAFGPICLCIKHWDIYLTTVKEYKEELLVTRESLPERSRYAILTQSMPRFLWIAKAVGYNNSEPLLEFVFDATDVESRNLLVLLLAKNEDVKDNLEFCLANHSLPDRLERILRDWHSYNRKKSKISRWPSKTILTLSEQQFSDEEFMTYTDVSGQHIAAEEPRPQLNVQEGALYPMAVDNFTFGWEIHYSATHRMLLSAFSSDDASSIAKENNQVDGGVLGFIKWVLGMDPEDLANHFLIKKGETATITVNKAYERFQNNLRHACACGKKEDVRARNLYFGRALHTLQDSFSHSNEKGQPIFSNDHKNIMKGIKYIREIDDPKSERNREKIDKMYAACSSLIEDFSKEIKQKEEDEVKISLVARNNNTLPETCIRCSFWSRHVLFGMRTSSTYESVAACRQQTQS